MKKITDIIWNTHMDYTHRFDNIQPELGLDFSSLSTIQKEQINLNKKLININWI